MPSWPKLRLRCPRRLRRCQMWKRHRSSLRHREISFFSAEDVGLPIHNSSICCYLLLFAVICCYLLLSVVHNLVELRGTLLRRSCSKCRASEQQNVTSLPWPPWSWLLSPSEISFGASSPWHGPASYPNSLPQCWAWWIPSWWVISPALWI